MTDTYVLGQVVPMTFEVRDADGVLAAPTAATLTITLPDGDTETPAPVSTETGVYTLDYAPATVGRYVAAFVTTGINAGASVDVFDVHAATAAVVTLADLQAYLGDTSHTDPEIAAALDAERAAQARVCRVDGYGPDLAEALKRRVARNLAARAVPVAEFTSFEGGQTSTRVPTNDPEIRRLEAPYRRVVVG